MTNDTAKQTALIVDVTTGARTTPVAIGDTVLQFNPNTGRQVRQVRLVAFNGEAATAVIAVGKNKGATVVVGLDRLAI